ncbi:MAG TPA: MFS transporter [Thermoleophilaceae bacterium]|jgi:EmrB/QacA subfamily drug resistance transporter|nr:MFS transporter [Thermoleophilaceae bacterium]
MPADPVKHPVGVLVVLLMAGVSFALSQTLVIPALPDISHNVHASPAAASWILSGFLLSASIATPIVGKLGDVYGKGRVLTLTLILFSVGGVVCALAHSIAVLILGRVIQGVAGGVFPLAFGIIRDTFPPDKVASGLGLVSAILGIGAGIGLPLSGVIADGIGVSWLFWISLIALPAALAAHRLVPASPESKRLRIDWLGAALLSASLGAVLLAVTEANDWGWISARTLGLIAGGLLLLAIWIAVESRVNEPLIDLGVLRERAVASTNLTGFLVGFAMFSSFLLIPQFAQAPESSGYGFGDTVSQAGLLLVPAAVFQLVAGPLAGGLGARIGFRTTLATGAGLASMAFVFLALEHAHPWQFVICAALLGTGISFAFASMANLIVGAVPQSEVGVATGINTIMRTIGGAFGAAVATAILTGNTIAGGSLPSEGAYTAAFVLSAVGGLLAIGAALLVPTRAAERARAAAAAT